jgi:hypothetical protein
MQILDHVSPQLFLVDLCFCLAQTSTDKQVGTVETVETVGTWALLLIEMRLGYCPDLLQVGTT